MAITMTAYTILFLFIGILILVIEKIFYDEMDKICNGTSSVSSIKDAFSKLYTSADTIYCVNSASTGCLCYTKLAIAGTYGTKTYYTSQTSTLSGYTVVTKVQSCTSYLSNAYASYGISFDDINALSEYLDYFGEIESSYSCSGFCSALPVFYFSDSYTTVPTKACKDSIKDDMLEGEVKKYGGYFTAIGCVMFLIWFVQYGLCCRKKDSSGQGTKRF